MDIKDKDLDGSLGELGRLEENIESVRKKMRKAKFYYKKKKMPKARYAKLIKGYKKRLKFYLSKKKKLIRKRRGEVEEIGETSEDQTPGSVAHRSQLTFEDLYSPVTEDESWVDPLSVTEFETDKRNCPDCGEEVRAHWIVCHSCRGDL